MRTRLPNQRKPIIVFQGRNQIIVVNKEVLRPSGLLLCKCRISIHTVGIFHPLVLFKAIYFAQFVPLFASSTLKTFIRTLKLQTISCRFTFWRKRTILWTISARCSSRLKRVRGVRMKTLVLP